MRTFFALDLTVARKSAGLSRADVRTLTGITPSSLQRIEQGRRMPSLRHLVALAIIYDRSFESSIDDLLGQVRKDIRRRLRRVPKRGRKHNRNVNRRQTLTSLHDRLTASRQADDRA